LNEIANNREAITKTIDYLSSNSMPIVQADKIGIVGHSLGGMTSLQAASQDDRLKAGVVCSAVNIQLIVEKLGFGENVLETVMGNSKFAARIKIPTLFIHGAQDKITPFEHGLRYYRLIRDTPKEALSINGRSNSWDKFGLNAHMLGLVASKRLKNEYLCGIVAKYMLNWFNFFLYGDPESWVHLFGDEARNDLARNVLSQLEMENIPTL
jgi:hypothetical protein